MLAALFSNLAAAPRADEFCALSISDRRKDYLAKGEQGEPVFLLHDASGVTYTPAIHYRYVHVTFSNLCRVDCVGGSIQDNFAIVACDPGSPELYDLFISCFGAAIETLPEYSEAKHISAAVKELLTLFRELVKPSAKEVTGLWAELFLIKSSARKSDLIAGWHDDPSERFDFSFNDMVLEVKSTTKPVRAHEFSLSQLYAPTGKCGLIASILMLPSVGGVGVMDLARDIECSIMHDSGLRQKLWRNVAKALGSDFSDSLDRRFEFGFSKNNLEFYDVSDIPLVAEVLDPRISNVRYVVSLVDVQSSVDSGLWSLYGFQRG
ncbi:PD-(D/E)XK motif protein [Pseudomonas fulva]|uniref:PD-(D/E)XK motif protein n=1 Tax=Pseudomonas fulva TaxID=47880 RepID=UPI0024809859|nr:PD-(D/E)XK motif protein [Pseudomonas fulva]